jgi:TPR repeat protein
VNGGRSLLRDLGLAVLILLVSGCGALPARGDTHQASFVDGMRAHLAKRYGDSRPIFAGLAAAGNVRAQFMMGTIHEQGLGVPKNLANAAAWYRKAAEGGNASAQYNLGVLYQFGKGIAKDAKAAAFWHRKAANQGHGRAQNNLSTFYYTGVGVERDLAEAWKWLSLSAAGLKGQGQKIALQNRATLEKEMTEAAIADGRRRVAAWRDRRAQ